jgi:integrase/recombinase XerD
MFETLFTYPSVLRRHREGPLAAERAGYLAHLATQAMAHGTLLRRASYCLCVAVEAQRWPDDHCFDIEEIQSLAAAWSSERATGGRASSPRWPNEHFRFAATEFLRWLGRLRPTPPPGPGRYDVQLDDFVVAQQGRRWQSEATCRSARWQIGRFLNVLELRGLALEHVVPDDIDEYFRQMAQRWGRASLRTSSKMLRAWFAHCETREWTRPGLASAILLPRIYRHEGLPLGPTWEEVGGMLTDTAGEDRTSLRDHAVLLLLSIYGLRSGEVRGLRLDDIDWRREQLRVVRSKSGHEECLPLEPRVGNAIARYLRDGRPQSNSRTVFLTVRAPYRPLSPGGLYHVVEQHLSKGSSPKRGRGPHALRHACARHLMSSGRSLKEVGDHLGHRSPESTRVYAKVDLASLRRVAFDELGGLA